jgi:hypothetical protein
LQKIDEGWGATIMRNMTKEWLKAVQFDLETIERII